MEQKEDFSPNLRWIRRKMSEFWPFYYAGFITTERRSNTRSKTMKLFRKIFFGRNWPKMIEIDEFEPKKVFRPDFDPKLTLNRPKFVQILWQFCSQPISIICSILAWGGKGLFIKNVSAKLKNSTHSSKRVSCLLGTYRGHQIWILYHNLFCSQNWFDSGVILLKSIMS